MNDVDVDAAPEFEPPTTADRPGPPNARDGQSMAWLPAAMMLALVFWASAFAAIKVGLKGYSPQSLALLRFVSASAAMGAIAAIVGVRRPARGQLPLLLVAALAGIPVYHVALNSAEQYVGAGAAALLINTSPVMAALMAAGMLRERLGVLGWIGTFVSFAGAAVVASSDGWNFDPRAGLVLVAALAGAVYTIAQKPLLRTFSAIGFTAWAVWIGTACLLPFLPGLLRECRTAPLSSTLAGAYMGVFPTAVSYAMWAKVISRMNVSRAVSFLYLVPVLAVVIAWLWLGEVPGWLAMLGGVLVVGGVVLVNASKGKPAKAS